MTNKTELFEEKPIFTDAQYEVMGLISHNIKVTDEIIQKAKDAGIIMKQDLQDNYMYFGHCRNATVAVWHADKNVFTYLRHKFGDEYLEDINHFEDDDGYDVFVPTKLVKKVEG